MNDASVTIKARHYCFGTVKYKSLQQNTKIIITFLNGDENCVSRRRNNIHILDTFLSVKQHSENILCRHPMQH